MLPCEDWFGTIRPGAHDTGHRRLPLKQCLEASRHALRARSILVRKGRWEAAADGRLIGQGVGFLVLDGALVRCVTAAHRTSGELLGPGDLVRPESPANACSLVPGDKICHNPTYPGTGGGQRDRDAPAPARAQG